MKANKGYTLIELIVVVCIMLIASNIFIIKYIDSDYKKALEDATILVDDIKYTQRISLIENQSAVITLELASNNYTITTLINNKVNDNVKRLPNNSILTCDTIGNGKTKIRYTKSGTLMEGSDSYTVTSGNASVRFTVIPSTGRVETKAE